MTRARDHVVLKGARSASVLCVDRGHAASRGRPPASATANLAIVMMLGMLHAMNPIHLFHVDTFLPKPGRDVSERKKCLLEALSAAHPISGKI